MILSVKKKVLFPDKTATWDHRCLAVVSYFKACFVALFSVTIIEYNSYLAGFA